MRLSPSFYEVNSPKEISSRMTADTAIIETVVATTVSVALRNTFMGIGGTVYLFWVLPELFVWLAIGIPGIVLPIVFFGRRIRNVSRDSQDRVADVGAMVTEVLSAMKVVQAFNQQDREASRFADAVERTFDTARRRIILRAVMTSLLSFSRFLARSCSFCGAGRKVWPRAKSREEPSSASFWARVSSRAHLAR